jgi:hypothetical protein
MNLFKKYHLNINLLSDSKIKNKSIILHGYKLKPNIQCFKKNSNLNSFNPSIKIKIKKESEI